MNEKTLSQKQIEIAANWWAERLNDNSRQTLRFEERNDPGGQPAALAELLASNHHQKVAIEKAERFRQAFISRLQNDPPRWGINVDYHPDVLLRDCLMKANIDNYDPLPWKTNMMFKNGGVQVSKGYGAPFIELIESEKGAL